MNKKAQTEDILAELVISMVLIVIGVFVLSNMLNVQKLTFDQKDSKLDLMLKNDVLSLGGYVNYEKINIENEEIYFKDLIKKAYSDQDYRDKLIDFLESRKFLFLNKKFSRSFYDHFRIVIKYPNEEIVYYYLGANVYAENKGSEEIINRESVVLPLEDYGYVIITLDVYEDSLDSIQDPMEVVPYETLRHAGY